MAQASYAIEYLGALEAKRGTAITSAAAIAAFPGATAIIMKSTTGCNVSINGGPQFPVLYDDQSLLVTGKSYMFDRDVTVVLGIYKAVV